METRGIRMNEARDDKNGSDKTEEYSKIKSKINGFSESSQVLLKVLEEVKDIHPFIGVAVIAFKAVVTLELKRRENDDKVVFLLVKMQDLMETLVQLRAIPSDQKTSDQLYTVEEKLASLCAKIEKDIQGCGNLCDTFSKKRFLVKLLKGSIYEIRLEEMAQTLDERQRELQFALGLFTARGIQSINDTLRSAHDDINMLLLLQMLQSSAEKEFLDIVNAKGGPSKCMQDEEILSELIQIRRGASRELPTNPDPDADDASITPQRVSTHAHHISPTYPPQPTSRYNHEMYGSRHRSRRTHYGHDEYGEGYAPEPPRTSHQRSHATPTRSAAPGYRSHYHHQHRGTYAYDSDDKHPSDAEIKQLKEELAKDVDEELNQNQDVFLRKFQEQQRQLLVIELTVVKQGDRVVREVRSGPHDRIYHEELRSIWKEMGWKLVVPTVEFVRTLHDYFVSQHQDMQILDDHFNRPPEPGSTPENEMAALSRSLNAAKQRSEEKWALKSLHYTKLQPVAEAFDADYSGYVSVWEANQVLSLRPDGWSLLSWLAYWASGRHSAITQYCIKIGDILDNMHLLLRHRVLPVNRHTVNRYLDRMRTLERVLATTLPCDEAPEGELALRISRYTQNEEERMVHILQALDYEIDGSDTIELITNRYQIERNFFPLVYLLLRRHLAVIRLACDVTLDIREMVTATSSLKTIFQAVKSRVSTLKVMFLDDSTFSSFLQTFAFGMYYGVYSNTVVLFPPLKENEDQETGDTTPAPVSWLTHKPPKLTDTAPLQFYSPEDPIQFESCIGDHVNGYWSGYLTGSDKRSPNTNRLLQFRISNWKGSKFEGDGSYSEGEISVEGSYDSKTNVLEATIVGTADINRSESGDSDLKVFISGSVDTISAGHLGKQYQISGVWNTSKEEGSITLRQTPAWTYQFRQRYPGQTTNERWKFALQAVLYRVRSKRGILHKAFCVEKLKEIRQSVYSLKQQMLIEASVSEDAEDILSRLAPSDSRLCHWLARFAIWPTVHFNAECGCGKPVIGSRILRFMGPVSSLALEEVCQHEGGIPLSRVDECIKTVQILHRRDKYELTQLVEPLSEQISALCRHPVSVAVIGNDNPVIRVPGRPTTRSVMSLLSRRISTGKGKRQPGTPAAPNVGFTRRFRSSSGSSQFVPAPRKGADASLSCVCCETSLPDGIWNAISVCLMCSVPEDSEKLLVMCSRCELLGRRYKTVV
ncbi:hypothetical protein E1B28_013278 [Marasmius oreades]|uniref:Uncharacterized protein n=1 Tax=Marasmius oreades TaxID=181124 RepID=A0A9P7RPI6_9AGAR|nr:uncharacterized protein E1B28_013278 [Marasmius oreades]KAG7087300.1 hypothetical protein E1B28_013278 [Marasmius oreades]